MGEGKYKDGGIEHPAWSVQEPLQTHLALNPRTSSPSHLKRRSDAWSTTTTSSKSPSNRERGYAMPSQHCDMPVRGKATSGSL
jgi:hypothetical protein